MNGDEIANTLIKRLLDLNFIVHRQNSITTSSIYLKLDYGVACGIRIADHPGRKKYHYRFNVIKDYKGNKVITHRSNLVSYFFDYNELDKVIAAVQNEKQNKINTYGIKNYQKFMERNSRDDLYKRTNKMEGEN